MFRNFFRQHSLRSLIWQLDDLLQYSFPSLLKVRHCNTLSLTATVIFDVCCFLSLRTRTVFFDRVPMRWEELYDLQVEPSLFQLSYEALRAQRLIVRKTTDRPKHQVYPDTLKYQCKLFGGTLRRVILVHMQFIKTTHCNQTPRVLLRYPHSS